AGAAGDQPTAVVDGGRERRALSADILKAAAVDGGAARRALENLNAEGVEVLDRVPCDDLHPAIVDRRGSRVPGVDNLLTAVRDSRAARSATGGNVLRAARHDCA